MRQKEYIGPGSIHNLTDVLVANQVRNVFLVSGTESLTRSGADQVLARALAGCGVTRFSEFKKNPVIEDLYRGLALFEQDDYDLVLAVGGGSVLDMAKMVNFFSTNVIDPLSYVDSMITEPAIGRSQALVAVPTTAGSGSEATHFAVLYIDHTKHSIAHETILPQVAIVDPDLSRSMSPAVTAVTGLDAFCQAVESYWSVHSTDESKVYSGEAIQLAMANLEAAVQQPDDKSREAMANAAHLAGKAINIAQTTAAHALSYPLTSFYNIPHGHAVALMLSSILMYNAGVQESDVADPRGVEHVKGVMADLVDMLGASGTVDAAGKINHLIKAAGLPGHLSELGIEDSQEASRMILTGFDPDRAGNNPRRLSSDALKKILINVC